jgi:hypothetical protein
VSEHATVPSKNAGDRPATIFNSPEFEGIKNGLFGPDVAAIEMLVREYGNSPLLGEGRIRSVVMKEILDLLTNVVIRYADNCVQTSAPFDEFHHHLDGANLLRGFKTFGQDQ